MPNPNRPPCYDEVNHKDCPDRQWCLKNGRSKCTKWVEYEIAHKAELEARHAEQERRSAEYEHSLKIRKRVHKSNRY